MTEARSNHLEHSQFLFLILNCCPTQHLWIWLDDSGIHLTSFINQTSCILQICSRCMKEICDYKTPTLYPILLSMGRKNTLMFVIINCQLQSPNNRNQLSEHLRANMHAGGIWVMSWDTAIAAPQGRPRDRPGPGDEYNTVSSNPSLCRVPALQLSTKLWPKFFTKIRKLCAVKLCEETTNASSIDTETWSCWLILLDSLSTAGDFAQHCIIYQPRASLCFSFKRKLRNENYFEIRQCFKTQEEDVPSRLNILDLPEEVLVNIMEYLDIVDIIK